MMKRFLLSFVLLFSLCETATLFARGGGRGGGLFMGEDGFEGRRAAKWSERLGLTDEQKEKIKEIRSQFRSTIETNHESLRSNHEKLREALKSNTSEKELKEMHSKLSETKQKLGDLRFEVMLKIRAILTPEQRAKFGKGHMGGGKRGRGGKGDGYGKGRGRGWGN